MAKKKKKVLPANPAQAGKPTNERKDNRADTPMLRHEAAQPAKATPAETARAVKAAPAESARPAQTKNEVTPEKAPRKSRSWIGFLVLYAALFLLVGAIVCQVLYRYSEAYEASIPEHVMDDFMAATDEDTWHDLIRQGLALPESDFEDREAIFEAYYDAAVRGKPLSYWKYMEVYTPETPVYKVRGGGMDLCLVHLVPMGEAGFGRKLWQIGRVDTILKTDKLEAVTVVIDAPKGEALYLNGVLLGKKELTDEVIPVPDMNPLEARFTRQPTFVRYRIDALYGNIRLTDAQGNALSPVSEEAGTVSYFVPETDFYGFRVEAPSNVTVRVNGAELTEDDARSSEAAAIFSGLETYTKGQGYRILNYEYSGLYTKPVISAVDKDGRKQTPYVDEEGKYIFFPPQDDALAAEVQPRVEEFFQCYMDYSAHAYHPLRHDRLLRCILPGTDLYEYVRNSREAMIWASATEVHYDELRFENFCRVNEDCFTCTIRFKADLNATAWRQSYSYGLENIYDMVFIRSNGNWYAAVMSAVTRN